MTAQPHVESSSAGHGGAQLSLVLGAIGVVFGDIGTSPLYAFRECLNGPHGVEATPANVLGLLSLIFWSIMLVVSVKYLLIVMRVDNRGEGGIFALLALLPERHAPGKLSRFTVLAVAGAALLYGDGVVTPAISVLSAAEGLEFSAPSLRPLVLPITCVTLLGLFTLQRRGTGDIGKVFGPVMLTWFVTIAALGVRHVIARPEVLAAISPHHAAAYFARSGLRGTAILAAVVLSVTGGEALYADMGHFGVRPIRLAWWCLALPALLLAYFGQGALVLNDPAAAQNPLFSMVPEGVFRYALVALASFATVIASQALISGAFSLTRQAIQLGYLPRLLMRHTAWEAEGQVYVPAVNWALALGCLALVLGFGSSSRLASAYGIAVSGTMAITSIVFYAVIRHRWHWSRLRAVPLLLMFLAVDLPFLAANSLKLLDGGYVPLLLALVLICIMLVWKWGNALFMQQLGDQTEPLEQYIRDHAAELVTRTEGTAVFVARDAEHVPPAMHKQVAAIPVLPATVIVLSIRFEHVPAVDVEEQLQVEELGHGFYRVRATFGYKQEPDVPELVRCGAARAKLTVDPRTTTYYLRRETFLASPEGKMGRLTEGLFSLLARNARPVDAYFKIPRNKVIEVGTQFDL
jgi:KUP system potassium uptake protein